MLNERYFKKKKGMLCSSRKFFVFVTELKVKMHAV